MVHVLLVVALTQTAGSAPVTIARGSSSGVEERREAVVRSAAEWDVLWKAHAGAQAAPAVDLAKNVVAAVFIGTRSTGGYSVEITGTRRDGDALVIEYVQRAPGRGDIVSQALTSPFHIVSLPRHDGPVRFEQRNATR